jgi:hypothetical protein
MALVAVASPSHHVHTQSLFGAIAARAAQGLGPNVSTPSRALAATLLSCLIASVASTGTAIGAASPGGRLAAARGEVARTTVTTASMVGQGEIRGLTVASSPTPVSSRAVHFAASQTLSVAGADELRPTSPAAPPPTPSATYAFSSGTTSSTRVDVGGSPADSNVAASRTHLCITTRAAFACYTKGGKLVSLGAGFSARPYSAKEFFQKSGLPIGTALDGSTSNVAKDGRIVFDQYRNRFFMDFQTREPLGRLMIAVSKSQDPRDGWWTYADLVGDATLFTHDYQKIGVNASFFLVSDATCKGAGDCPVWKNFMYSAGDLTAGRRYTRGEWHVPASNGVPGSNGSAPCDHDTPIADAFWVNRDDDTHVSVWAVRSGAVYRRKVVVQTSTSEVNGVQLGGSPVKYNNIGRTPQNCEYRNGKIVWVSNDGHTWSGQSQPSDAVRLGRLNVSQYFASIPSVTVEIDRIFGRASASDPSGSVFDYGWPAVAANANGDIVVGEIRSNATIYPELRASAWFAGQPDISSSVSLQTSSSPLTDFHMAGASADPSTSGVYVSQQYGSGPSSPVWRVRVAKVLGAVYPDLISTLLQAPSTLHHGPTYSATVTILNQGDKTMPASQATLRLSSNNTINTIDALLKTFSVPSLVPNQSTSVVVEFKIANSQPTGAYFLGVMLDSGPAATEYSETNNQDPFLAGNHGNVAVSVQ